MSVGRIVDRVLGILTFGRVGRSKQAVGEVGEVWLERFGRTVKHQHWQPYGFSSAPKDGSVALVAAMGSHGDSRLVWCVGDRRYTIALEAGEVAIVDDLGQRVHLTRTGIVIDAPLIKLGASALLGVARETDPVQTTFAADFASWVGEVNVALGQIAAYVNGIAPATVTPVVSPVPSAPSVGTITGGSAVVKAE